MKHMLKSESTVDFQKKKKNLRPYMPSMGY